MNNWLDFLSMLGSLVLIVLVLVTAYFFTRWYALKAGQTGAGKYIRIWERVGIGSGSALVIIQVADKYYLLGVNDKSVRLLCELPEFGKDGGSEPPSPSTPFSRIFSQLTNRSHFPDKKKDDGDRQ